MSQLITLLENDPAFFLKAMQRKFNELELPDETHDAFTQLQDLMFAMWEHIEFYEQYMHEEWSIDHKTHVLHKFIKFKDEFDAVINAG